MEKEEKELMNNLRELYWEEGKSMMEISRELKMDYRAVWNAFEKYKIKRRTIRQSQKVKWKHRKKVWTRDDYGRFVEKMRTTNMGELK